MQTTWTDLKAKFENYFLKNISALAIEQQISFRKLEPGKASLMGRFQFMQQNEKKLQFRTVLGTFSSH